MTRDDVIRWAIAHAAPGVTITRRGRGIQLDAGAGLLVIVEITRHAGAQTPAVLRRLYPAYFRSA